jgi:hypothetical protein
MNNSVRGKLVTGDVRANYIMIGATWTFQGASPDILAARQGTTRLANTTMETFQQGTSNAVGDANCFTCHTPHSSTMDPKPTTDVSRVFPFLRKLF